MAYAGPADVSGIRSKLGGTANMLQLFHTAVSAALGATEACPFADLPVIRDRTVCAVNMARGSLCLF